MHLSSASYNHGIFFFKELQKKHISFCKYRVTITEGFWANLKAVPDIYDPAMLTRFISGLPAVNLNSIKCNISFSNILKCRACRDSGNYYFLWTHRPLTKVQFQISRDFLSERQMLWFCREKRNTKSSLVSWCLLRLLYCMPGKRSQKCSDQTWLLLQSNSASSSHGQIYCGEHLADNLLTYCILGLKFSSFFKKNRNQNNDVFVVKSIPYSN